ncbi:MAG TPA: phytoene desaturase family protein [Gemmatimonadales bacterium]|nr:phytoene desaturase family protein [Gemmatimonadales bacterium]
MTPDGTLTLPPTGTVAPIRLPSTPAARGRSAIVVGAGIGGLATAVRLAHAGWKVTVLERHGGPGGRAGVWQSEGFTFDTGPSLVMMVEYWQKLFADIGRKFEDYVELVQIDPCYRIRFPDGSVHDRYSLLNRFITECEKVEPGCTPKLLEWLAAAGQMYTDGLAFISRNMHTVGSMVNLPNLGMLGRTGALGDLQKMTRRFFKDERMQASMTFQTLYLGLSPYDALAIYSLLPYVEVAGGIHFPRGGMHRLAVALEQVGREMGIEYVYDAPVASLEKGASRVEAVVLQDGTRRTADIVVTNADLPYAYDELLKDPYPRIEDKRFSCSVVLMYLGLDRQYPHLQHHEFIVGNDMETACADMFDRHRMPDDPPYYVVTTTRTDPTLAPPGGESVFVLVLAPSQPADRSKWIDWSVEGPRVEQQTLDRMERQLGMTDLRKHIVTRKLVTPQTFLDEFGNKRGEAFGLSHNLMQIGYFRPHNRHAKLENLYFIGQSTHPGCGLPMVLISAECVVDRIREEVGAP